jgi:hypothetical protein
MLVNKVIVESLSNHCKRSHYEVQLSYVQLPAHIIDAMCIQLRTDRIGLKRERLNYRTKQTWRACVWAEC